MARAMGGTKKKGAGSSSKSKDSGPRAAEVKKDEKKDKEKGGKGLQQKARISVMLNEGDGIKAISRLKAITSQELARNTGVKISVANAFLKSLEAGGNIKYVGGYSGHKVYALIQEKIKNDSPEQEVKIEKDVASEGSPQDKN